MAMIIRAAGKKQSETSWSDDALRQSDKSPAGTGHRPTTLLPLMSEFFSPSNALS